MNRLIPIAAVACGGAAGALLRWGISLAIARRLPTAFPLGNFTVNMIGCLALGFCMVWLKQSQLRPEVQSAISDARAALEAGQLLEAKSQLDTIVSSSPSDEAIKLLGDVNMKLLKSSIPMPGKERYSIQSGDYLQKIAKNYNITVALSSALMRTR